jgi:hypothetical protein
MAMGSVLRTVRICSKVGERGIRHELLHDVCIFFLNILQIMSSDKTDASEHAGASGC